MKKLILSSLAVVATAAIFTSCLKDDQYGTNIVEVKGVAFTQAKALAPNTLPSDSISLVLGVGSQATALVVDDINISLEADQAASSDITVSLAVKNSNIPDNGDYLPLTAAQVSFPATVTIPKGATAIRLPLTLANTSLLDPTITYALGLTITTVAGGDGVQIVSNRQDIVVAFNIKNKYDGIYKLRGKHNRSPNNVPYSNVTMYLITTGPSSVAYYNVGRGEYSNVISTAPGVLSSYGEAIGPNFTFNPTTNDVVSISNHLPGVAMFLGPNPGHWDETTKRATFQYYYTTGAGQDFTNRGWSDTLDYVGPR